MSKKFWNFGSAWFSREKGPDVINVALSDPNDPKSQCEVQIFARHVASGEELPLQNFFLKRNTSKDKPGANENWPDYQLTFITEE
jgi:hypothetical protein